MHWGLRQSLTFRCLKASHNQEIMPQQTQVSLLTLLEIGVSNIHQIAGLAAQVSAAKRGGGTEATVKRQTICSDCCRLVVRTSN